MAANNILELGIEIALAVYGAANGQAFSRTMDPLSKSLTLLCWCVEMVEEMAEME
ncbi:hypothetical protein EV356DRAFT_503095 [Viridothelium virens]|uniref:Uncharacterized protein n=1 Tax=Viridothelium virens TaxID=1048519 RepID=A0A6A6H7P0_VIRVR|nr:hypothetical protein EV356DRAFT_503095 [Viridothelium virens]